MGGSIAVTIREQDGKTHKMCRWTNSLPAFVNNIKIIEPDRKHLDEYLATWYEMKEDYLKNKSTGQFEHNMTDMYAPHPYLAPESYGLVVVDYVKKVIATCNSYSELGSLHAVSIRNEIVLEVMNDTDLSGRTWNSEEQLRDELSVKFPEKNFDELEIDALVDEGGPAEAFFNAWEAKKIKKVESWKGEERVDVSKDVLGMSAKSVLRKILGSEFGDHLHLRDDSDAITLYSNFELDLSPMKIVRFEHGRTGMCDLHDFITSDLEFKLTKKEEHLWKAWYEERE